jgi:glycosyltransferase involved in cell wall biosynthesis
MNAPRVAVLGFPSDKGQGGGFTLLSRIGPSLVVGGGALAWIEDLHAEDAPRRERWLREGVTLIPLHPIRNPLRRWRDAHRGFFTGCETAIDAFKPDIIIIASGTDRPSPHDNWQLKRDLAARYTRGGTRLILMHQLSEAGQWIVPDSPVAREWLEWQRTADFHQFVSDATWRETEANFGFPLRGEVVRNNYNVPYNDPPPWPDSDTTLRLAFTGRFDIHQKGLDLLLNAFARPALINLPGWTCDLYGSGSASLMIENRIRQLGLTDRVFVRGRVNDIRAVWAEHHAIVMPSRAEGLSLSLCEAMLCERPAVAVLVGGTADLLIAGETGWAAYPDAEHLAQQLTLMLDAHLTGRLREMGLAAGLRARATFPANPEATYVAQLCALAQRSA